MEGVEKMESTESDKKNIEIACKKISELDESILSIQDSLAAMTDIIDSLVEFKRGAEGSLLGPQPSQDFSAIQEKLDMISKAQEQVQKEVREIKQAAASPRSSEHASIEKVLSKAHVSKELLNEFTSKVDEAKRIKDKIDEAGKVSEKLGSVQANAEKTTSRLESLLKEKAGKDKKKKEELDNALMKIRDRIGQIDEKFQEICSEDSEAEVEGIAALRSDIDELVQELADVSYDITTLQERTRMLDGRISFSSDFSKNQLEKILSILKAKTEILDRMSVDNEKTHKDMANIVLDVEDTKIQAEKRISTLSRRVRANMESISELDSKTTDKLDAVQTGVEGRLAEFSVELSNVSPDKIKEMDNKVAEDRMLIGKLTVLIKKLQETYDPTKINSLRMKVERLETILRALEEGKSAIMDKITTLDGQISKVDLGRILTLVDKVETVRNEIGQLSKSLALPADVEKKVSNMQDKVRYLEREVERQADTHKTIKQLDMKMAVMKEHVRGIKDEVKKKKNIPVHIGKEYLMLD